MVWFRYCNKRTEQETMIFRVKYLIAGVAPATELYESLKTELEQTCRYNIGDIYEAEVLGPYPGSNGSVRPVVPVTFKIETHGYDSEASVVFDIFMAIGTLKQEFQENGFAVGLEELVVDGERYQLPIPYRMGELPLLVL